MVYEFIIPIEQSEDAKYFIKKMYCLKCRESGGCYPQHCMPLIEDGYHYDIISCECSKCCGTFDLKFFNQNSFNNQTLKKLVYNSDPSNNSDKLFEKTS